MQLATLEGRIRGISGTVPVRLPNDRPVMRYSPEERAWIERQEPWHPRMVSMPRGTNLSGLTLTGPTRGKLPKGVKL